MISPASQREVGIAAKLGLSVVLRNHLAVFDHVNEHLVVLLKRLAAPASKA